MTGVGKYFTSDKVYFYSWIAARVVNRASSDLFDSHDEIESIEFELRLLMMMMREEEILDEEDKSSREHRQKPFAEPIAVVYFLSQQITESNFNLYYAAFTRKSYQSTRTSWKYS